MKRHKKLSNLETRKSKESGFQKNHSCEAVMLDICDKWLSDLEEKKNVIVVFLDLRRAFEMVNRVPLLKKMQAIGIGGNALSWFDSYLSNRFQKVNFWGSYSKCLKVNNGVPQGTTLGPLLFLLYWNDVVTCVKHCHCKLFADDTMLFISGTNIEDMINKLNEDLETIFKYLCMNNLAVKAKKCQCLVIQNKHSLVDVDNMNIKINNAKIAVVDQVKYLGIIIDNRLNFQAHVLYIHKKNVNKNTFFKKN
jgi:ribonuclease P/MRP protein subunit RPP40